MKKKESTTRIHWSRLMVAIILSFFLLEGAWSFGKKILLERRIHARLLSAKSEFDQLKKQNIELQNEKEALYTPEKIEKLARENLDLTKPDEIPVKIVTEKDLSQHAPQQGRFKQEKQGKLSNTWWEKIKEDRLFKWLLKLEPS